MRDDRVRQMFERELEIPDVVQEKMHEAYRQMGADMDKIEKTSYQKYIGRRGTRYVKAASFILFALMRQVWDFAIGIYKEVYYRGR